VMSRHKERYPSMDWASSTTCPPAVEISVPTMGETPAPPAARKRGMP